MAQIYSKQHSDNKKTNPKKETLRFILDYSKALSVINCSNLKFNMLQN